MSLPDDDLKGKRQYIYFHHFKLKHTNKIIENMQTDDTFTFIRCFYPKRITVHSGYTFFCQYMCSLGTEPMSDATQCFNH